MQNLYLLVSYPPFPTGVTAALLKRADEGVYEAKSRGRNQVIARAA